MALPPVIEFRDNSSPVTVLSTVTLSGTGAGGAIPGGTSSSPLTLRIYNNYAGAAGVGDALNCVLAVYDDTLHPGSATTEPTLSTWVQVQVLSYDGNPVGADGQYWPIGGTVKHTVPINGATLGGTGAHYLQANLQVVVPATAAGQTVTQGLWLEYSWIV